MDPNKDAAGWTPPKDDSVAPKRRSSRRDMTLLVITLAVIAFAVIVLNYAVNG